MRARARARVRRREGKISQAELAMRSGVSLGSIKRFEGSGEISLISLLRIAAVLGYETDFEYDALWLRDGFSISPFYLPLVQFPIAGIISIFIKWSLFIIFFTPATSV
jgi:transcriptional regulator with XRE-family HTH domain